MDNKNIVGCLEGLIMCVELLIGLFEKSKWC